MIITLMKQLMADCNLKQKDLANLLGVPVDRVKNLTTGRAKKLTREEGEVLIKQLHIRGDWLATGEGPMFQSESEREMHARLNKISSATAKADLACLDQQQKAQLQEILFAAEMGDASVLQQLLTASLSQEEITLVENYRKLDAEAKAALITTSSIFAQQVQKN